MAIEVKRIMSLTGNAFLVKREDRVALVDTLSRGELWRLRQGIRKCGLVESDIDLVLLTHHHVDHAANAAAIKELSGAELVAGAADAPVIEGTLDTPPPSDFSRAGRFFGRLPASFIDWCQEYRRVGVDRKMEDGDFIEELGLEVVSVPGHTPGSLCYLDRQGSSAFIGDLTTFAGSKPRMPALAFSQSLEKIFQSQERIAGMAIRTAYPGHGGIISPDASRLIGEFSRMKEKELLG